MPKGGGGVESGLGTRAGVAARLTGSVLSIRVSATRVGLARKVGWWLGLKVGLGQRREKTK